MKQSLKSRILALKKRHPSWGYKRIAHEAECNFNTVRYHLSARCKLETIQRAARAKERPKAVLYRKIAQFCNCAHHRYYADKRKPFQVVSTIPTEEVLSKIGPSPVCYLTGEPIDTGQADTYSLDHRVPLCRGGMSTIDNLELATKQANQAKNGMTVEEFLKFCKRVLLYHGFAVGAKANSRATVLSRQK